MDSEKASETVDFLVTYAAEYAIAVVGVIVILIVGFIAAGWVGRAVRSMLGRSKRTDPLITNFVAAVARTALGASGVVYFDDLHAGGGDAHGVVAYARRAGDASREIRELVDRSVTSTQTGAGLVKNAGRTMEDIVASIDKVTRVISEISTGAQEQSQGIGQVNTAVAELDTMTQHNASMVEETSSAAEEMRHQAEQLAALIASFRLSGQTDDDGGERVPVLRAVAADRYDPEGRAA